MTTPDPNAVLIAPDGCTKYLASTVQRDLKHMQPDAVLEVRCASPIDRIDLAEWCLSAGKRVLNPFDHWNVKTLLVENTHKPDAAAAQPLAT